MITVLTVTYRGTERLQAMAESLARQTHQDFEWVIVDDLYETRKDEVSRLPFPNRHMPPRNGVKEGNAWSSAMNTGILHARGELLHFMADSVVLTRGLLARHWELYKAYGPKVLISGPYMLKADDGQIVEFGPRTVAGRPLADGVLENTSADLLGKWYWASKNDSAPTEMAVAVNGCDEQFDGYLGGMDVIFAARMRALGCRWLIDTKAQAFEAFEHLGYKGNKGDLPDWRSLFWKAIAGDTWAPNGWSIKEERKRLCVS